ncbi:divergent PAP2 family protein [Comamonas sediminis]|uniref:divergent PAP2 family protein n=1 Tax=Comamonas sediminis TaxID=1783360 RepID=UPI003D2BD852
MAKNLVNIMDYRYLVTPFLAWLIAGVLKFLINSARSKCWEFRQVGYGGLPSNHSAIVSSAASLVALQEGVDHPAFGVAVAFAFIVILDASSLRRQVGKHAEAINCIVEKQTEKIIGYKLRERMGHTPIEIGAGIIVGFSVAWAVNWSYGLFL